jgi:hypothetical protein
MLKAVTSAPPVQEVTSPPVQAVKVTNLKSAKRLFTRILTQVQQDNISVEKAKLLTYMLKVFSEIMSANDLEERLIILEEAREKNL